MEGSKENLSKEVQQLEKELVEHIVKNIEDLDIDINITETKVSSQGKFKKYIEDNPRLQIRYEIHYLDESLSIDPIDKKILYRNNRIGYNIIEISNVHYIKLRMSIISRKKYFEMIDKKRMLKEILK
ncbi:MAG: hypothetical protein CMP21_03600 [Rickettsiales bacterium]|nr:hypothetical protein [Rickettsiales bacterium]|tara:strand:+ start:13601 stop:13981 length:381 start_codon:yes stop_codon:yes gene_type:complete